MSRQKEGLKKLENKSLDIDVEDFDPHSSRVTISVTPTIGEWELLNKITTKVLAVK